MISILYVPARAVRRPREDRQRMQGAAYGIPAETGQYQVKGIAPSQKAYFL